MDGWTYSMRRMTDDRFSNKDPKQWSRIFHQGLWNTLYTIFYPKKWKWWLGYWSPEAPFLYVLQPFFPFCFFFFFLFFWPTSRVCRWYHTVRSFSIEEAVVLRHLPAVSLPQSVSCRCLLLPPFFFQRKVFYEVKSCSVKSISPECSTCFCEAVGRMFRTSCPLGFAEIASHNFDVGWSGSVSRSKWLVINPIEKKKKKLSVL